MPDRDANGAIAFFRKLLGLFDRIMGKVEWFILMIAAIAAIVVMFVVSADALGRYLFNKPLIITHDLVSRYLLPIIMLSMAGAVLRKARHISVDLFAMMMPQRLYRLLLGISLAVAVPIFWIMARRVAHTALQSFEQGKVTLGLVPWPIWIEQAIYAVCMGLLVLRLFQIALANLASAVLNAPDIGISLVNEHDDPVEEAI